MDNIETNWFKDGILWEGEWIFVFYERKKTSRRRVQQVC